MKTLFIFTAGILTGGAVIAAVAFSNGPISFNRQALVPLSDTGGTGDVGGAGGAGNHHVGGAAQAGAEAEPAAGDYRWTPPTLPEALPFASYETPHNRLDVHEQL